MENIMIGDRVRRKRLAAGMSLQDLAELLVGRTIHLSKAALSNYETNKTVPNAKTLWALAEIFDVSMEYFIREQTSSIALRGYRKRSRLTKARHDQIFAIVQNEIEKRVELETILGLKQHADLPEQSTINSVAEAEQIAAQARKAWELGDQPISSVSALLEEKGWYVIQSPGDKDFDGLSGVVEPQNRPFAVSRAGIAIDRMRLNLLHEVGHAYITSGEEKLTEKAVFRFASAVLFPKAKVYEEVWPKRSSFTIEELVLLKKKYGLSIQAMAFRFRDLEIISQSYFSLIFTYINQKGFKVKEPGSEDLTFQEEPTAFQAQVYRAMSEGLISEHDVSRFLPRHTIHPENTRLGSSSDIRRLLALPKGETEKVLEAAANAAVGDYENPEFGLGDAVDDIKEYP
jgi:transcriptional regulator with XRE-family HTH domain/Zn-dependent peptidase ImmA (M78 family)